MTRLTVTKQELVADNVEAFGHLEAAKKLRKAGVPFSIAYWLIFGKAPKVLLMPVPALIGLLARAQHKTPAQITQAHHRYCH